MNLSKRQEAILDAQKNVDEALPYLNKIPTLQSINNLNPYMVTDISNRLAMYLKNLLQFV